MSIYRVLREAGFLSILLENGELQLVTMIGGKRSLLDTMHSLGYNNTTLKKQGDTLSVYVGDKLMVSLSPARPQLSTGTSKYDK